MKTKAKITRKDTREHLAQFHLACELVKVIHHYFPGLLSLLKNLEDPRDQRYITYESHVLLMTRILSSIFYISSMRKTSQEFNSDTVIENIGYLCGRPELPELPYWETINDYLKRLDPSQLQGVVCGLVRRLLRSRVFEGSRIRGKYWQVIVDGTQLESSRRELDPKSLYRIHRKDTSEEYREYYYYVLEAKLVLRKDILVSIMTEFVENEGFNTQKNYGYCLEHMYSRLYQEIKNHYYLIQIGHMIAQVMEAWESLWKKVTQSREQKHRRILESWKQDKLKETMQEIDQGFQIRFG